MIRCCREKITEDYLTKELQKSMIGASFIGSLVEPTPMIFPVDIGQDVR